MIRLSSFYIFLIVYPLVSAQALKPEAKPKLDFYEKSEASPRATTTGKSFEKKVRLALESMGYAVEEQVQVGTRPNGGKHRIDLVITKEKRLYLVSLKWQQTGGTAEQKVPYELICLSEAMKQSRGKYQAAYLVLGGEGWSLKEFYLSGGLDRHLSLDQPVFLLGAQDFLEKAKNGLTAKKPPLASPTE